jgi:hypothetical protein
LEFFGQGNMRQPDNIKGRRIYIQSVNPDLWLGY